MSASLSKQACLTGSADIAPPYRESLAVEAPWDTAYADYEW